MNSNLISPSGFDSLLLLDTSAVPSTLVVERLEKSSPLNEGETEKVRESLCGEHSVVVTTIVGRPLMLFHANTLPHFQTPASS